VAIRRAKQKQQVIEKLSHSAPPGEVFVTTVHVETGPSPWLNVLFEEIPGLLLVVALMRKMYFLTLTNTSVVVNTASRWNNRPGEVVAVFPRHAFPASQVKRARVWSKIYVQFPNSPKPTRLNVHGYWRNEFDQLLATLPPTAFVDGQLPPQALAVQQAQGQYPAQAQYPAQGQIPAQGQYQQPQVAPVPQQHQIPQGQVPLEKNPYQS
jgi:hypothetical protein